MEVKVTQKNQVQSIYFGAPLTQLIENQKKLIEETSQFLIVVNQSSYDAYYEKIQLLLGKKKQQFWYISQNNSFSGTLGEFEGLLSYAIEMEIESNTCVIAFGDAGAIQVSGFFSRVYLGGLPLMELPTSLVSLEKSLIEMASLSKNKTLDVISIGKYSKGIFLDSRFIKEQSALESQVGFGYWVRMALAGDKEFYQNLYNQFRTEKQFKESSLIPYLTSYLNLIQSSYEEKGKFLSQFGLELVGGLRYMSLDGKRNEANDLFVSIGFSLFISCKINGLDFDLDNWFAWLKRLGYSLEVPEEWLTSSIVDRLLKNQQTPFFTIITLTELWKLRENIISISEMLIDIEEYRHKISTIDWR